jgi:hypothetical protein
MRVKGKREKEKGETVAEPVQNPDGIVIARRAALG